MSKAGTSDWRSKNLRNYNTTVSVGYEFMYLLQLWMYKADNINCSTAEYYTGDSSCCSCSCSCTTCDCDTDDDDLLLSMQVCVACAFRKNSMSDSVFSFRCHSNRCISMYCSTKQTMTQKYKNACQQRTNFPRKRRSL